MQVSDEIKSCFREMSQNPDYIVLRSERKVKNEAWIQANIWVEHLRGYWGFIIEIIVYMQMKWR